MSRHLANQFFEPSQGGDTVFFQHVLWFLGQPEFYGALFTVGCYIALAIICGIRLKRATGVLGPVLYSMVLFGVVGVLALGFADIQQSFASGAGGTAHTLAADVFRMVFHPLAQACVFLGLAALVLKPLRRWKSSKLDVGLAYFTFAVFLLGAGAISSYHLSTAGADGVLHDTYFVVVHWQYVLAFLVICLLFAFILRAVEGHYPRVLGWLKFASFTIGVVCVFLPQYLMTPQSMPRRYVDYEVALATWTGVTHLGAALIAISLLLMIVILALALYRRLNKKTDQL